MRGKGHTGEQGGILMETVITLPVYLVLLAGLFWLGELCVIRQRLVSAERLRLWEQGTRLAIAGTSETGIFTGFASGTSTRDGMATGVSDLETKHIGAAGIANGFDNSTRTTRGWGGVISGFAMLNTRRSEWSYGIVSFARTNLWGGLKPGEGSELSDQGGGVMSMVSRGSIASPMSSCLPYRRDNTSDDNSRRSLNFSGNTVWNNVYGETWPWDDDASFPVMASGMNYATALSEYDRHEQYNEWSK